MKPFSILILALIFVSCGTLIDPLDHEGQFDPLSPDYIPQAVVDLDGIFLGDSVKLSWSNIALGVDQHMITKSIDGGAQITIARIPATDSTYVDSSKEWGERTIYRIVSEAQRISGEVVESRPSLLIGQFDLGRLAVTSSEIHETYDGSRNYLAGFNFSTSYQSWIHPTYMAMYNGVKISLVNSQNSSIVYKTRTIELDQIGGSVELKIENRSNLPLTFKKELFLITNTDSLFMEI